MGGTLLGKAMGFLREVEMARVFGASFVADSLRGAISAAWLPIAPLQGDTVPAVLIPLHRKWHAEGTAREKAAALTVVMVAIAILLAGLVWLFAGTWTRLILGGFGPQAEHLATEFVAVLALGMPGSVLFNCMVGIEVSLGYSRAASLRAPVQNVGLLVGIFLAVITGDPLTIAWCMVIAFTGIAAGSGFLLWRDGQLALASPFFPCLRSAVKEFWTRFCPMMVQPLAEQGNTWLERLLGSASVVGTLASVDYARTLSETAAYALSQPLGLVVLAREVGDQHAVRQQVTNISRPLLLILLPASVLLGLFAPDLVRVIFSRGAFQADAVFLTVRALDGIAIGLWAATVGAVLLRMLNSAARNATAAKVVGFSCLVNVAVNIFLVPRLGSLGIGLGEACRGIALLGGSALALGCGALVTREVLRAVPIAVAAGLLGFGARLVLSGSLARLGLAAAIYAILVGGGLLARAQSRHLAMRFFTGLARRA